MLAKLGAAEISGRQIVGAVYPRILEKEPDIAQLGAQNGKARVLVVGAPASLPFVFAPCCEPIPGDRIVGIRDQGVVTCHSIDCIELTSHEDHMDRWIDLKWDENAIHIGRATNVDISLANQAGALGSIATLIGEHGANIENFATLDRLPDFWRLRVNLAVRDVKHLSSILTALEAQTIVTDVKRVRAESR
jgi:(p)ppGpp synthase/HD superfamily hydrolase